MQFPENADTILQMHLNLYQKDLHQSYAKLLNGLFSTSWNRKQNLIFLNSNLKHRNVPLHKFEKWMLEIK